VTRDICQRRRDIFVSILKDMVVNCIVLCVYTKAVYEASRGYALACSGVIPFTLPPGAGVRHQRVVTLPSGCFCLQVLSAYDAPSVRRHRNRMAAAEIRAHQLLYVAVLRRTSIVLPSPSTPSTVNGIDV